MEKIGKIIKSLSGYYYVLVEDEIITCRARGNFRNDKIEPVVGDIVKINVENDLGYVIEINERKNELIRPKISNIDYNIIVTAVTSPDFSSKLLDKLIMVNEYNNIDSIIIFTKFDLLDTNKVTEFTKIKDYYSKIGYNVFTNSDDDVIKFKKFVSNKFVSICGQSGSGKSTFINRLSNEKLNIETAEISKMLGRGKHTTRHTEFYKIDDFYIADTPGFSSIDVSYIEKEDLKYLFKEFLENNCKFQTCNHIEEPKCSIKDKSLNDEYFANRYKNYKLIFKEQEEQKRRY